MRVVFMGTPAFSIPVIDALAEAGHEIVAVYTQPDRPAGRGHKLVAPPVKDHAARRAYPVLQPKSLRPQPVQDELAALHPDLIVVAAYGIFLPKALLYLPPHRCLNIHPSLLPKYRGPSPVSTAILEGDAVTGASIIVLDEGMDSGPIVAQRETPIGPREAAPELTDRLFRMGADLLLEVLPAWVDGSLPARPQDEAQATITRLRLKEEGQIDWTAGADRIARQVRAYQPWPGSYTQLDGKSLKVLEAEAVESEVNGQPGTLVDMDKEGIGVSTGHGVLKVVQLQLEGKKSMTARELSQGYAGFVGSRLG